MKEIYKNIFREIITYSDRHLSPRNLYIVRGQERSLMVDTAFRFPRELEIVRNMIESLGIAYEKLDIFITHDHPDHTGLVPELTDMGARVYMNPEETRKRADLLHSYLTDEASRIANLRIVGVTKENTPEVYDTFMEYTTRAYAEYREERNIVFNPIHPGAVLEYGGYRFQVIPLKGHTFGQCGLYEKEHKLLFCGDQIMKEIVPIVGSQQKDLGLLRCYLDSLGDLMENYKDCYILPCHYDPIEDVSFEANRIILRYLDKCEIMKDIVTQSDQEMTTRDVGVRTYGRSQGPPDYKHFVSCTQIWAKTFSCLEFLYEEGFVERTERDGIIYWKKRDA